MIDAKEANRLASESARNDVSHLLAACENAIESAARRGELSTPDPMLHLRCNPTIAELAKVHAFLKESGFSVDDGMIGWK